jgi:hypothetical protein
MRMKPSSIDQLTVRRKFLVNHCLGLLDNPITSSFPHPQFGTYWNMRYKWNKGRAKILLPLLIKTASRNTI